MKANAPKTITVCTTEQDVMDMVQLGTQYAKEAGIASGEDAFVTFDPNKAFDTAWSQIQAGNLFGCIARVGDEPIGFAQAWIMDLYYTRPIGQMDMLYVVEGWRKSPVGRILVRLLTETLEPDVSVITTNIMGKMPTDRTLANMLKKFGYEDGGTIFVRKS